MDPHTLNIARVTGLPSLKALGSAFAIFGVPADGLFGVINPTTSRDFVSATLIFRCSQTVRRIEPTTAAVVTAEIDKVAVYPFTVYPAKGVIEVRAGGINGLSRIQDFLTACLSTAVIVEPVELDISIAARKLNSQTERFLVRSVRVAHFAAKSHMSGPYSPRFTDSDFGMDFIDAHADSITTANVRFAASAGTVALTLNSRSCFKYSCNEDDSISVQNILRRLV